MIEPARRKPHNLQVLMEATSNLPFFKNLMKEPAFEENKIHVQLCKRMVLLDEVKGNAIIKRSKVGANLDQRADRLFILLGGEVAVYRLRDDSIVQIETEFYKAALEIIQKYLTEQLETHGYVSKQRIFDYLDDNAKAKYADIDHVNSSSLYSKIST